MTLQNSFIKAFMNNNIFNLVLTIAIDGALLMGWKFSGSW